MVHKKPIFLSTPELQGLRPATNGHTKDKDDPEEIMLNSFLISSHSADGNRVHCLVYDIFV